MKRNEIWLIPNILTLLRIVLSPVFMVLLLQEKTAWGLAIFIVVAATDLIDGAIARKTNQKTSFGEFLDPMADKVMVVSAIIALMIKYKFPVYGLWIFTRDVVSLAGSVLVHKTSKSNWKASQLGKVTTFMQVITIGFFIVGWKAKYIMLLLAMISSVATAITYVRRGINIVLDSKCK